jgi:uncharacterized membrane protein YGL010W
MEQVTHSQRSVDVLIGKYAESHLNPVNEVIHVICVPAIVLSVTGLLWAIHPLLAMGAAVVALIYYISLSTRLAAGMLVMLAALLGLLSLLPAGLVLPLSGAVFVIAWIGQFIGHKIEGKKPSFLDDLRFLLIGPLFVLGLLYRRCGMGY